MAQSLEEYSIKLIGIVNQVHFRFGSWQLISEIGLRETAFLVFRFSLRVKRIIHLGRKQLKNTIWQLQKLQPIIYLSRSRSYNLDTLILYGWLQHDFTVQERNKFDSCNNKKNGYLKDDR